MIALALSQIFQHVVHIYVNLLLLFTKPIYAFVHVAISSFANGEERKQNYSSWLILFPLWYNGVVMDFIYISFNAYKYIKVFVV